MIEKIFRKIFFIYLAVFPLIPTGINEKFKLDYILFALLVTMFFIKSVYCKKERTILKKRLIDIVKDPIVIVMAISIILMTISSIYVKDNVGNLIESFRFFTYIILYIAIKYEFNLTRNFTKFNVVFLGQSFIIFVIGIIELIIHKGVQVGNSRIYTVESTWGHPSIYAAYIIIMIFPLIVFLIKSKSLRIKVFTVISILCGAICLGSCTNINDNIGTVLLEVGGKIIPSNIGHLEELGKLGIIAVIAFIVACIMIGFKLFSINKKYKNKYLGVTTGVCATFVVFMIINVFNIMIFIPKVMTIFIALVSLCSTIDAKDIRR